MGEKVKFWVDFVLKLLAIVVLTMIFWKMSDVIESNRRSIEANQRVIEQLEKHEGKK